MSNPSRPPNEAQSGPGSAAEAAAAQPNETVPPAPSGDQQAPSSSQSAWQLRQLMNKALSDSEPQGDQTSDKPRVTPSSDMPRFPTNPGHNRRSGAASRLAPGAPEDAGSEAAGKHWTELAKRIAWRTLQAAGALVVVAALVVFFVVRHYEANLPSVEQLKAVDPPQVTRVLARDGTLLANLFTERRTVVAFSDIPNHVKQAFLAAEDASFYEHEGLDYLGMLRAMGANLKAGRTAQGGSTITQQVIKNVLLDSERSYRRKIRETILARRVEQHLTKDEIFGLYLNHIYLGHGRYGVEEAARYYFAKRVSEIDMAEAALLAGLVAAPERYSPRRHPDKALQRRRYVLGQMLNKGFMTEAVHGQASIVPMKIAPAVEAESELCPEVITTVRRILAAVEPDRARRGGYTVHTSIDPALQTAARKAVRDSLDAYAKRQKLLPPFTSKSRKLWGTPFVGIPKRHKIYVGTVTETNDAAGTVDVMVGATLGRLLLKDEQRYNPQRLPPSQFTQPGAVLRVAALENPGRIEGPIPLRLELGPQSALVSIDVRSREVRALVGSYEAVMGGLDRSGSTAQDGTMLTKRQPGSAFKPLMYSYALHSRHFTPASVFEFDSAATPEDTARFISLRVGVAKSDNQVAERVLKQVGPANVVEWARAMGIGSELKPDLSLALGSYEVSVFELTNAYATLAAGGSFAPPRIVTKIVAPGGAELSLPAEPPKRRVMSEEEAYLTTSLLRGVVEHGTGQRARAVGRPVAGKTGTTNKNRDAWFVGYSTDFVAGCWTGYDDSLPLGWGEYGAVAALPAWVDFMKFAHQERPRTQFPRPAGIVTARIDPNTGLLPYPEQQDAVEEEFLGDTLPTTEASPPNADVEAVEAADTGPGADHEAVPGDHGEATPTTPTEPGGDAAAQPPGEPAGAAENNEPTNGSATLPEAEPPPF